MRALEERSSFGELVDLAVVVLHVTTVDGSRKGVEGEAEDDTRDREYADESDEDEILTFELHGGWMSSGVLRFSAEWDAIFDRIVPFLDDADRIRSETEGKDASDVMLFGLSGGECEVRIVVLEYEGGAIGFEVSLLHRVEAFALDRFSDAVPLRDSHDLRFESHEFRRLPSEEHEEFIVEERVLLERQGERRCSDGLEILDEFLVRVRGERASERYVRWISRRFSERFAYLVDLSRDVLGWEHGEVESHTSTCAAMTSNP